MGNTLLYVLMAATLLALVVGVVNMLRTSKQGQQFSQRMMIARVALQAVTLVVVVVLMLLRKS